MELKWDTKRFNRLGVDLSAFGRWRHRHFWNCLKNPIWLRWMGWIWHRFRNVGYVCLDLTVCASRLRRSKNLAMGAGEDLQPECSLFCRAEWHIRTQNTFRQCWSFAFWPGSDTRDDNPQPKPWYQLEIVPVPCFRGMFSFGLSILWFNDMSCRSVKKCWLNIEDYN